MVGVEAELAVVVVFRVVAEHCCLGRCESPGERRKARHRRRRILLF